MPKSHRYFYIHDEEIDKKYKRKNKNKNKYEKHRNRENHKERLEKLAEELNTVSESPLNIVDILYLYKIKSPKVLENEELMRVVTQVQQDLNLDLDELGLGAKRIKDLWIYQMKKCGLTCDICGGQITKQRDLSLDHRYPRSLGGKADAENSKPAHRLCNNLKGCIPPRTWEVVGEEILQTKNIQIIRNYCGYNYRGR